MPKKYPLEFKKQAIRRYEKGESIPVLCQELHISQSTFYHWRNQYRSIQTSAHTYTPAEFDALIRRLQKAEHKLSIIQLSGYLSKVPLQDKLATLEHFHNEMSDLYSVHELCEALDVSRGTFYNHIFRRADRSKYESEKAQLILKVKQIFDDSEQRYGADKIRAVLAESGLRISTKRISSIMQELGLHSIRTDAKKVYKNQMRKKQNLLRRKFTADHPNQVWVSDITYFKIKNAWVYGRAGDALIGIYVCQLPIRVVCDEFGEVGILRGKGVFLILGVGTDTGIRCHAEFSCGFLIRCRDRNDPRSHRQRTVGFLLITHSSATSFVSNTQYHITSAIAILKAKKSKRNNDVRTKLYPQPRGDFFCFTAADETLLPQAAKHGDDAEIICVWIHSDSSFCELI